jgi:hypothetical protein
MYEEPWWERYRDAILETNFDQIEERIEAAEKAIAARSSLNGEISLDERRKLQLSKEALQILKEDRRRYQKTLDWSK